MVDSASELARRTFPVVRRGYDPDAVRSALERVGRELATLETRESGLLDEIAALKKRLENPQIDEATLMAALGQQSAQVLRNAHDEAARIAGEAEEVAAGLIRDTQAQVRELQVQAETGVAERVAEAELLMGAVRSQAQTEVSQLMETSRHEAEQIVKDARQRGQDLIDQAQEARKRILSDLAHRRRTMTHQIEQFRAARDILAQTVGGVRGKVDQVLTALESADESARDAAHEVARQAPPPDPLEVELAASEPRATPSTSPAGESPTPESEDSEARTESVEGLFARLRAELEENPVEDSSIYEMDTGETPVVQALPEEPVVEVEVEVEESAEATYVEPVAADVVVEPTGEEESRRDALLDPVAGPMTRRLKRALQDDQNRLLDRLRAAKSTFGEILEAADEERMVLYREAVGSGLEDAAVAGVLFAGEFGGNLDGNPAELAVVPASAEELAGTVVRLLRRRISEEEDLDKVGAAFREWRGDRIERLAGDFALEVFSAAFKAAATAAGKPLVWVVGSSEGECADCEDNSLAGALAAGEAFPTGHAYPPAHAGCRCVLVMPT